MYVYFNFNGSWWCQQKVFFISIQFAFYIVSEESVFFKALAIGVIVRHCFLLLGTIVESCSADSNITLLSCGRVGGISALKCHGNFIGNLNFLQNSSNVHLNSAEIPWTPR